MYRKILLLTLSICSIISATYNIFEEPTAGNWPQNIDFLLLWAIPVLINGIWGILANKNLYIKDSTNLSLVYFFVYGFYALNGSSADEIAGVGHFHLYTIPFFAIIVQFFVMLYDVLRTYFTKPK